MEIQKKQSPELQVRTIGIAFGCPLGERVTGCILGEIHDLPLKERLSWMKNQPEEKAEHIYLSCRQCYLSEVRTKYGIREK